ncbi:MAG: MFS transporter [Vulcanimicrobiaceae bacterium]
MTTLPSGVTIPRRQQQFAVAEVKQHPQTGIRGVAIGFAAVFAMLVDGTASNIINTGLPYLQGLSAATPDESSWIITAFNATYYATILFSPWLYARFGRKPLLLGGLVGFGVTSLFLANVSSLQWVVLLRVLQGACLGCVFVPAAALLFTSFPLAFLPFAPAFFATVVLGASTIGSVIGGYLSETYGGHAVYVPSAIATFMAAALVYFAAPSLDAPKRELQPDLVGYGLSVTAFGALQYLANEGERRNWFDDPSVVAAATILAVAVPALLAWELYLTSAPHVNFRLLAQKRNLAVGSLINIVLGAVGYSVISFILYLETLIFATETLAGELILLRLATYIVGILTAFMVVKQRLLGVRAVVIIAAIGSAVAFVGFARQMTTTADATSFISVSLFFGLFFSMLNQPVPALVLGTLDLTELPSGVSIYKLSVPIGLSIGTGFFQTFLDHRSTAHLTELAGTVTRASIPVSQYLHDGGKVRALAAVVNGQAEALAFQDVMIGFALLVLLTIPLVYVADTRPGSRR